MAGVTGGILPWGTRSRNPLNPETLAVLAMVPSAWQFAHGGYHVQSIAFYEVYGKVAATIMKNIGYRSHGKLPVLTVAFGTPGPVLTPTCFFARKEDAALDGLPDKPIAANLGVSYDTIRKTWDAVYQRVDDVDHNVLPQAIGDLTHRGVEKRRVLLEYLRQHLEELRPFRRRADVGADRIDATAVGR